MNRSFYSHNIYVVYNMFSCFLLLLGMYFLRLKTQRSCWVSKYQIVRCMLVINTKVIRFRYITSWCWNRIPCVHFQYDCVIHNAYPSYILKQNFVFLYFCAITSWWYNLSFTRCNIYLLMSTIILCINNAHMCVMLNARNVYTVYTHIHSYANV